MTKKKKSIHSNFVTRSELITRQRSSNGKEKSNLSLNETFKNLSGFEKNTRKHLNLLDLKKP